MYSNVDYLETLNGFKQLVELVLAQSIDISDFSVKMILSIGDRCWIKPVISWVKHLGGMLAAGQGLPAFLQLPT